MILASIRMSLYHMTDVFNVKCRAIGINYLRLLKNKLFQLFFKFIQRIFFNKSVTHKIESHIVHVFMMKSVHLITLSVSELCIII